MLNIIVREQERLKQQQRVESLLIEGLDSGESVEMTDDWWNSKRGAIEMLILNSQAPPIIYGYNQPFSIYYCGSTRKLQRHRKLTPD